MKTKKFLGLAGAVLLALTGCIPVALHPFYTEKDVAFDPALLGVWGEKESDTNHWAFTKGEKGNYGLTITDDGATMRFDAHLFKLGTNLFLDITPDEKAMEESKLSGLYTLYLVPAHSLARVAEAGSCLKLEFMDHDWLTKRLELDPKLIRHEKLPDKRIVLTASTRELQDFVLKHLNDTFIRDSEALKRIVAKP